MKKFVFVMLILSFIGGCQAEKDTTFLIAKDQVGKLNKSSLFRELDSIYALDSIVKDTSSINLGNSAQKVKIFEKGGLHLLTLSPSSDSLPKVENIRVYDPRFTTEQGINLNSTFKDLKTAYEVRKVVTSSRNIVIFFKNSDLYVTISKEELPSSLRYAASTNIEAVQIPDEARIKYLMVGWD